MPFRDDALSGNLGSVTSDPDPIAAPARLRRIVASIVATFVVAVGAAFLVAVSQDDDKTANEEFLECVAEAEANDRDAAHCSVLWPE